MSLNSIIVVAVCSLDGHSQIKAVYYSPTDASDLEAAKSEAVSHVSNSLLNEGYVVTETFTEDSPEFKKLYPTVEFLFRLPLGARFTYIGSEKVYVLIDRQDCGTIASWEGNLVDFHGQSILAAADSYQEFRSLKVIPV